MGNFVLLVLSYRYFYKTHRCHLLNSEKKHHYNLVSSVKIKMQMHYERSCGCDCADSCYGHEDGQNVISRCIRIKYPGLSAIL